MSAAAIAERQPSTIQYTHEGEEYGRSTSAFDAWGGALALRNMVELREGQTGYEEQVFANYTSALREMLATDKDFRRHLDIDDKRSHKIIGGQVCDPTGRPMVEVIDIGIQISREMATTKPEYTSLLTRDIGDRTVAQIVDALPVGKAYITRSMEPVDELDEHKNAYEDLGYRKGLGYDQFYVKVDENTVIAGSYSVDMSDEQTYREQRADMGVPLSEGANPNTIIREGFEIDANAEETEQFVRSMRADYYKRRGVTGKRHSISEYLEQNEETVKSFFDIYYPELSKATSSGQNNATMQNFARTVINTSANKLKAEVRQNLMRVANGKTFDKEMNKTMDAVIRYAIVEELRKGLPSFIGQVSGNNKQTTSWPGELNQSFTIKNVSIAYVNQLLANNVDTGVQARRSYGGCSATSLSTSENDHTNIAGGDSESQQNAYGGKACRSIKNGMSVTCPHCKQKVKTVVPKEGGEVFCSNQKCAKAAASYLVKKATGDNTAKTKAWYSYN